MDADAIGMKQETAENLDVKYKPGEPVQEEQVWEQLRTVYDPEIPVNFVELGLVYDLEITPKEKGDFVHIKMTLTAPGCGMGPAIARGAGRGIRSIPGVTNVFVEIVWEPLWDRDMMSDEAKLQLGMM